MLLARDVAYLEMTGGRAATSWRSKAAYLGHFAEQDAYEPQSNVDELKEALLRARRPVTF